MVVPTSLCAPEFYALDVKSGDILWQMEVNDFMATDLPDAWLSQRGKLIVGGGEGVRALDLRTGDLLWSASSFSQVAHVVYGEGRVFVEVTRATFKAYDLETGLVQWQSNIDQQSQIYYDAASKLLITVPFTFSGNHHWLDPNSGKVVKVEEVILAPNVAAEPVVEKGKLYYGAFVMDAATAAPVCVHPEYDGSLAPGNRYYDLLLIGDMMYISTRWSVVAFDTAACQPRWEYQPQAEPGWEQPVVVSNPAALNGVVYAIFSDATLRAINQQSGMEVGYWQAEAVGNSQGPGVAVSGDMLIASFGNGQIYAFGP